MSTFNPIDKATDPSFTESAKGLMTLFCIGVIHLVIGVNLTDAKIAIPWFPTITFERPEYLVYLFWGFNFYAIYRYTLHNGTLIRKHWYNAFLQGLKRPSGKNFIQEAIWFSVDNEPYSISTDKSEEKNIHIIGYHTDSNPHTREYIQDRVFYFTFRFTRYYRFVGITCSSDPQYEVNQACFENKEIRENWGFTKFVDDDGSEEYKTDYIDSKFYRYKLFTLKIRPYLHALLTNKSIFDLLLPIALNVFLLFASLLSLCIDMP